MVVTGKSGTEKSGTGKSGTGKSGAGKNSENVLLTKKAGASKPKKKAVAKTRTPDQLEKTINYHFKDQQKLVSALTHASSQTGGRGASRITSLTKSEANSIAAQADFSESDNERLEFLGDRVLGLSISACLLKLYPQSDEGGLARRYNSLVRRKTCAEIAIELSLGDYVILSAGEERSGGRKKSTILANAMEALLGAVFLDGGYKAADKVICKLWAEKLAAGNKIRLDAKTALQEWAQGQGLELPVYKHVNRTGPDHNPVFDAKVYVAGLDATGSNAGSDKAKKTKKKADDAPKIEHGLERGTGLGSGDSKRIAEQSAARDLLIREKVWEDD